MVLIGQTLDRKYEIVGLLGTGGMGSVYEARNVATQQRVAVKVVNRYAVGSDGDVPIRFRHEARAAARIDSPHIVRIHDFGEDAATSDLYLVMEHLEGEDLQRLLDRTGPLAPDVALRVAGQALAGLAAAHAAGIIHRDVKPANLFLARGRDGEISVKLVDFGIAKMRADVRHGPHTTGLTEAGAMMGTMLWMSPEQTQSSGDVDARADVWSLGSVLYAMLEGHAPHHEHRDAPGRLINTICNVPAPSLLARAPWVPKKLASVVQRALAIDPSERYASAGAMLDEVRRLSPGGWALRSEMLVGLTPEQRAVRPPPLRRRGLLAAGAAAAVAGGCIVGYRLMRPHEAPPVAVVVPAPLPPVTHDDGALARASAGELRPVVDARGPAEQIDPSPATHVARDPIVVARDERVVPASVAPRLAARPPVPVATQPAPRATTPPAPAPPPAAPVPSARGPQGPLAPRDGL